MRVVVAIGGSVLAPDLEHERIEEYANAIRSLADTDITPAIVVGGGPVAREYISTARALGINEIALDEIGIGVTRLNARLLAGALGERAPSTPPTSYAEAADAVRRGDLPILGGTVAGQTTDAVAAALAEYLRAERLVYATSVDGVYDSDPARNPDATRFEELTPLELVGVVADVEMVAGSLAPVDLLAAKLIQRSGIRTVVVDGADPDGVARAARGDPHDGTDIVPD